MLSSGGHGSRRQRVPRPATSMLACSLAHARVSSPEVGSDMPSVWAKTGLLVPRRFMVDWHVLCCRKWRSLGREGEKVPSITCPPMHWAMPISNKVNSCTKGSSQVT